jgi:hypothetical protein
MRLKIIFILTIFSSFYIKINAQVQEKYKHETFLNVIENVPAPISVHVPEGYLVLDTSFGNLNLDSILDLIIVLKSPEEDTSNNLDDPVNRPLLILLGQTDGTYKLVYRNNKVVFCNICGGMMGDPFNGITIRNGYFTVEHYGGSSWRWSDFITFKFNKDNKRFYLHREDLSNFHASNPDKIKTTIKTKKDFGIVDFEQYDYEKK